ncbi:MAG: hypothetical protein ABL940_05360 [Bacteroidia bacterium]
MPTNANIYKLGFGFIEEAYEAYFDPNYELKRIKKERINKIIHNIKHTPEWLKSITHKAQVEGIDIETALLNNAKYVINEEDKKAIK